jgi:imidazoleglycerol-phosphate dehydratase
MRKGSVKRTTKETEVEVAVDLDGMKGITRYADVHVPMDEALTRVAIDISGRPFLVFKAQFVRDKVGTFDTELVQEWFQAFAVNSGVTLHLETLYGSNDHHIAESCFKGLARALRAAVAIDPRAANEVPSTKGTLGG